MGNNIDWTSIRTIGGSAQEGFEELCSQLVRGECPLNARFERNGKPDGGVECYYVLDNGEEWGWQAKYFNSLGDSQWQQLDKSVKSALDAYKNLKRYYICVPYDRPNANIDRKMSAMERWDKRVLKWKKWAKEKGLDVDFIYWGSSELIDLLSLQKNCGRVKFWFGVYRFDSEWFVSKLDQAIQAAGPRYTPEINIKLPITEKFEAFSRANNFFSSLKSQMPLVRKELKAYNLSYASGFIDDSKEETAESFFGEGILKVRGSIVGIVYDVIDAIPKIEVNPVDDLPFKVLLGQIDQAAEMGRHHLRCLYKAEDEWQKSSVEASSADRFKRVYRQLSSLIESLEKIAAKLSFLDEFCHANLLILTGRAGTGKSHLLCDVASERISNEVPTILLMGQRFLEKSDPWRQTLDQLDLSDYSVEEFIGALESAAQLAKTKVLVMLDALNEGAGRSIWPDNLAAYLSAFQKSKWISVVLAIRKPFDQILIPEEVSLRATRVDHEGFGAITPEAVSGFFRYYGIEVPSAPYMSPEFNNPLFLKVLCEGLKARNESQVPRGVSGISSVFDFFIDAINKDLSKKINYNPKVHLVRDALGTFIELCKDKGEYWLPLEEVERAINSLLPGRNFDESLYHGMVLSGLFIEEFFDSEEHKGYVVLIAYERMADHYMALSYLDEFLDRQCPERAFSEGQPLNFLGNTDRYVSPGLIESFCTQLPEICGKELSEVLPSLQEQWGFVDAFFDSIVFRKPEAFSAATRELISELLTREYTVSKFIDVLFTIATIHNHPLNAIALHDHLNSLTMPDRDAWWTIAINRSWESEGMVSRFVYWALGINSSDKFETETVKLCAITLGWLLTSSNRFLRDRATKALVCLLSGRTEPLLFFVEKFKNVNDVYVMERVYAVAYGCCMRSNSAKHVGAVAAEVYDHIFKGGTPIPHILLRDYARGVIERALFLQADLNISYDKIVPPYVSKWPTIPTEKEIEKLKPKWDNKTSDNSLDCWARNRIASSVLSDDFARYVIGTNSGHSGWLNVLLSEPEWVSNSSKLELAVEKLPPKASDIWNELLEVDQRHFMSRIRVAVPLGDIEDEKGAHGEGYDASQYEEESNTLIFKLKKNLGNEEVAELLRLKNSRSETPHFDLAIIQRYVLWRVFDLGWDLELFGDYDHHNVHYYDRRASKPERIGKKYQWIGYHEISAYISDHYQRLGPGLREDVGKRYQGAWQGGYRDIDPSCVLLSKKSTDNDGLMRSWWSGDAIDWMPSKPHGDWINEPSSMPPVESLLVVNNKANGTSWLNLSGFSLWKQPIPPEFSYDEIDQREMWYFLYGYIVKKEDARAFLSWAKGVDFWNRWMPEPAENYRMFLGEYGWSPAARFFDHPYWGQNGWVRPEEECPVDVCVPTVQYLKELSTFDCSIDDSYNIKLPTNILTDLLGIKWAGDGGDYIDDKGVIVAYDPTVKEEGSGALLVKREPLLEALEGAGLSLCWAVTGGKSVSPAGLSPDRWEGELMATGAYLLENERVEGFMNYKVEEPRKLE